ncbi:MAG TPA: Asp-tRNA(Asn)/Glu-tRNA(Gln) amidotransferase subunit GatC [Roseiflexaceae bacterium]|nr:Asp-tRNA(Asn)/Glu-tRNA(Gln) amidotransferase subunit GatC [Roseiflexaceae bacterium]
MSLTREQVQHVARLARLRLTAEEEEQMQSQLSNILDYIDMLSEVDVQDVPATAQVTDLLNIMRPDEVRASMPREDVLANAPDQQGGMFRVKAIFGDE